MNRLIDAFYDASIRWIERNLLMIAVIGFGLVANCMAIGCLIRICKGVC